MPQLLILDPKGAERRHELTGADVIFGREGGADVVLVDRKVSRRHARVFMRGPHYWIEDLGSANGVLMSGTPIPGPRKLVNGTEVDVGGFRITFAADPHQGTTNTFALIGLTAPVEGQSYILPLGDLDLGRGAECVITVRDPSVSRVHAILEVSGQGLIVEDKGSSNGTKVNGQQVGRTNLQIGDQLQFGNVIFEVALEGAQGVASHAGAPANTHLSLAVSIGALALVVLFVILSVVVHRKFAGQTDPFARYERGLSAGLDTAATYMQNGAWEDAVATYSDVVEQDPINEQAIGGMAAAEKNRDHQTTLALAQEYINNDKLVSAHRLLRRIDETAYYGAEAQKLRLRVADALVARYVGSGGSACASRQWAYCHRQSVLALDLQPSNEVALKLVRKSEAALKTAKSSFVPWAP